ncbi:hypothetical protein [Alicyclobacillus acidiphilus]|uniref:hypothetical protein n=1 Tax=Alicyclobacillus acidiphilus TaxID=182455 RepID=UPI00082D0DED|nr:hypothetical protein [Alicyclobacillus acidiphilus]
MAFANTFVGELNRLVGRTVEIAYDNMLLSGVIASARGMILTVIPSGSYYTPSGQVTFININAIDFVQVMS